MQFKYQFFSSYTLAIHHIPSLWPQPSSICSWYLHLLLSNKYLLANRLVVLFLASSNLFMKYGGIVLLFRLIFTIRFLFRLIPNIHLPQYLIIILMIKYANRIRRSLLAF